MKELYDSLSEELKKKFSSVKLLVMDFDGTLTDNKVYTSQDGSEEVMADRGDGLGLEKLREPPGYELLHRIRMKFLLNYKS